MHNKCWGYTEILPKRKIKFKLFPKSLRVYTVEEEVAEGFGMRLTKGADLPKLKS